MNGEETLKMTLRLIQMIDGQQIKQTGHHDGLMVIPLVIRNGGMDKARKQIKMGLIGWIFYMV